MSSAIAMTLAVHAEAQARHRDADLGGGDVAVLQLWIIEDLRDAGGEPAALRGLVLDGRPRRADDGKLRRDEDRVREHQQQDDEDRDDDGHAWSSSLTPVVSRFAMTLSTARSAVRSIANS